MRLIVLHRANPATGQYGKCAMGFAADDDVSHRSDYVRPAQRRVMW
jgi:hypothetical protein